MTELLIGALAAAPIWTAIGYAVGALHGEDRRRERTHDRARRALQRVHDEWGNA